MGPAPSLPFPSPRKLRSGCRVVSWGLGSWFLGPGTLTPGALTPGFLGSELGALGSGPVFRLLSPQARAGSESWPQVLVAQAT